MTTIHPTIEERLALIEEALYASETECRYPFCTDDESDEDCAHDELCDCFEDLGGEDDEQHEDAISSAALDGTLQALQSLISIAANGTEAESLEASQALLGYGLAVGVA